MLYSKHGLLFFTYGYPSFVIVIAIGVGLFQYLYNRAAKNEKANTLIGKIPVKREYLKRTIKVLAYIGILSFAYVSSLCTGTVKSDLNIAPLIDINIDRNFTYLEVLGERLKIDPKNLRLYKPGKYAGFEEEVYIPGQNNYGSATFRLCRDRDAARKMYDSKLEMVVSENILQESGNIGENRYYLTLIHGGGRGRVLGEDYFGGECDLSILKSNLIIDVHLPYYPPELNLCTLLDTPLFRIMRSARVPNLFADALILETAAQVYAIPTE
ncbi:MAG: hypothetical protein CVU90_11870 [Firmicutes bacterium HGW-Firmicutes-15]|nr:MAG: hypothetical protein CVU90_11870 [Firmicutes bacterium HGW-Firmicutes-15]